MSLDQPPQSQISTYRPLDLLPDEILLGIFDQFTPFQRCLLLSICRHWNDTILHRQSFWQRLFVPNRLSVQETISILQIFNQRSRYSLEALAIETSIQSAEDLDQIFLELSKSSNSIRQVYLVQPMELNTKTRKMARESLPNLNTLGCSRKGISHRWRSTKPGGRGSRVGKGLHSYSTSYVEDLKVEDEQWLSELRYLKVNFTDSLKDLHRVLSICQATLLELELTNWKPIREEDTSPVANTPSLERITFRNLFSLYVPTRVNASKALNGISDIEKPEEGYLYVGGLIQSLLCFVLLDPVEMLITLCDENTNKYNQREWLDQNDLNEKVQLLFRSNSSIKKLTIFPLPGNTSRQSNTILESLRITSAGSSQKEITLQEMSEDERDLLPNLRALHIPDPSQVNENLLIQCYESRTQKYKGFQVFFSSDRVTREWARKHRKT